MLTDAGYIAAKRTGSGTSELIRKFDPTAEEHCSATAPGRVTPVHLSVFLFAPGWSLPYTLGVLSRWKLASACCQAMLSCDQRIDLDGPLAETVDARRKTWRPNSWRRLRQPGWGYSERHGLPLTRMERGTGKGRGAAAAAAPSSSVGRRLLPHHSSYMPSAIVPEKS
jgi:hypothetical protein